VDRLPDRQFSKLLVSATHPNFRFALAAANIEKKFGLSKKRTNNKFKNLCVFLHAQKLS
jgi:hypothetical protein